MRRLRFFFDYVSPNAWVAWTQLPALAERHGVVIEPIPVLFAGLLEAHGGVGPAETPAKMRWMVANNLRKAARLGVPLHPPAYHPFNPLLALRVSSLPLEPGEQRQLIDAVFRAVWVDGRHVSEPATMVALLDEVGLDGPMLVSAAQQPDAKERVRRQTDDAIGRGVFGVPTMLVDGELFWGYDDFPQLERFLAGEGTLSAEVLAAWAALRPSAVRERSKGPS
jgi:2-hydroxychromene-2-carboxylate isomerase